MRLTILCACLLLGIGAHAATCNEDATQWSPALEVASRILNASIEAERQARRDFETLLDQERLSQREIEDYRFYLDDLERLVRTNTEAVEHLRCMSVQAAPEPQPTETSGLFQSQEDLDSKLDAELSASLSQFDELLLRETEEARSSPRSTSWSAQSGALGGGQEEGQGEGTQGSGSESGAQSSSQGGRASSGTSASEGSKRRSSQSTSESSARVASSRGAAGISTGTTPPDIPDGSDDDVVARQLREAAENETDPVLREKLWAEYRKYKNEQS